MDPALLVGRGLLAVVLAIAGISKLHNREGARNAVADFGVPAFLAAPIGLLVPLIELSLAVLLLPAGTAWWGAAGTLALLLVFTVAIAGNLLSGRAPRCNCFGQIHSQPVNWTMVARNAILASFAAWMVWTGPGSQPGLAIFRPIGEALQFSPALPILVLIGMLALGIKSVVLGLLIRQQGRLLLRVESLERASSRGEALPVQGLPVGAPAPGFELSSLAGESVGLDTLLEEKKAVVLIFSNPTCGPCAALMPNVTAWQKDAAGSLRIAVITSGPESLSRAIAERHGVRDVLLETDGGVAQRYRIEGTPSGVLVRSDRTIGSRVAFGRDAIESLVLSVQQNGHAADGVDHGHGMAA